VSTVPTIPSFTVGQILGAASLQALADMETWLGYKLGGLFQAKQTVAQSLANGDTAITFSSEDYDTDGGHSTSSLTSRYTAQTSGLYWAWGTVHFTNANTDYAAFIRVNNSGGSGGTRVPKPASGDALVPVIPVLVTLNAGDFVEIVARQASGGAINSSVASGGSLFGVAIARPL